MVYSSIDNQKIKEIKKLNNKKYRDLTNKFLVEGDHLVIEAYKKGYLEELILEENVIFPLDIKTSYVTRSVIKYITALETPPNIMGICKKINEQEIGNRVLILDNIQDPGNLGTIIRSCVAFNIDTIILSNNSVDLYNSKVIRATQGLIFHINIIRRDLKEEIPLLKSLGYTIFGTNVEDGIELKNIEKPDKYAIIMGNEGNGVSDDVNKLCDKFIYIKMSDTCESLNVGVATSVILYEFSR